MVNANLTSNLINPNFLKIGSSLLSTIFITLSFLKNYQLKNWQLVIDSVLLGVILLNILNTQVDNTVHLFGVGSTMVLWVLEKKGLSFNFFILPSIIYMISLLMVLWFSDFYNEEQIVVDLNYGCPVSFFELINAQ